MQKLEWDGYLSCLAALLAQIQMDWPLRGISSSPKDIWRGTLSTLKVCCMGRMMYVKSLTLKGCFQMYVLKEESISMLTLKVKMCMYDIILCHLK